MSVQLFATSSNLDMMLMLNIKLRLGVVNNKVFN